MRRSVALGILLGVGALSAVAGAYQAPPGQRKVVEVEKLKDNLYLLKGGGGNTAVFVGSDGVVVVDTKLPGWGQPILDKIKEITPKPVTTIVNTHTHGDHVSGNVEFPATVDVIVQENTKTNMDKMMNPPGFGVSSLILSRIGWPQPGFFASTTVTPFAPTNTAVLPPPPLST